VRLVALFGLATVAALAIQTVLPYWFPIRGFIPNLILILSVDLGFRHPSALAAVIAFAMGYATDALSGSQIGLNAFSVTLVFLLSYYQPWPGGSAPLMSPELALGAATAFAGALITSLGALVLASNPEAMRVANAGVFQRMLIQALLTALLAPPVFSLLRRGKSALGLPPRNPRD
jgi:rod shape-determining protein MreD